MENLAALVPFVKHLENAVGHRIGYTILEPFPCLTLINAEPAIITIQNAGKIIANHVGLGDLTFVIAVTPQPPSTAGHVELRYGKSEVFVEISNDICGFQESVLATLCHEISHKFLHSSGIKYGSLQLEQEMMTDVATVYLGLGKLMLNGCECERTERLTDGGTRSTTLRTGYIDRDSFAFVYRLVCAMRQIPRDTYLKGLSGAARQSLLKCEEKHRAWFLPDFHIPARLESLFGECQSQIDRQQHTLAELDQTLRAIERNAQSLRSDLSRFHTPLAHAKEVLGQLQEVSNPNPHLRFLDNQETKYRTDATLSHNKAGIDNLRSIWSNVIRSSEVLQSASSTQSAPDQTEIISCPIDDTRMRVPIGRERLLVTCGTCRYKFFVNTAKAKNKQGILRHLDKFVRRNV